MLSSPQNANENLVSSRYDLMMRWTWVTSLTFISLSTNDVLRLWYYHDTYYKILVGVLRGKSVRFLSTTSHFVAISLLPNHARAIKITTWKLSRATCSSYRCFVLPRQPVEEEAFTLTGQFWNEKKLYKHYKTCTRLRLWRIRNRVFLWQMISFIIWFNQFIKFFLSVIDGTRWTSPHSSYTLSFLYWEWSLGLCLTRW